MFIAIDGGSVGYQIGGSSTDLIILFMNDHALHSLLSDKFKLGADASVAAGPVGRKATAATDLKLNAEILSYSRSKGIFAGPAWMAPWFRQTRVAIKPSTEPSGPSCGAGR